MSYNSQLPFKILKSPSTKRDYDKRGEMERLRNSVPLADHSLYLYTRPRKSDMPPYPTTLPASRSKRICFLCGRNLYANMLCLLKSLVFSCEFIFKLRYRFPISWPQICGKRSDSYIWILPWNCSPEAQLSFRHEDLHRHSCFISLRCAPSPLVRHTSDNRLGILDRLGEVVLRMWTLILERRIISPPSTWHRTRGTTQRPWLGEWWGAIFISFSAKVLPSNS